MVLWEVVLIICMVVNSGGSKAWGQEGSGGNHLYYSGEWGDKVKIGDKSGSDVDYVTVCGGYLNF